MAQETQIPSVSTGEWKHFISKADPAAGFGNPKRDDQAYRYRQIGDEETGYKEFQRLVKDEFYPDDDMDHLIETLTDFQSKYEDAQTTKETEQYPYESQAYTVFYMIGWEAAETEEAQKELDAHEARFSAREAGQKLMRKMQAERELERIQKEFPELLV